MMMVCIGFIIAPKMSHRSRERDLRYPSHAKITAGRRRCSTRERSVSMITSGPDIRLID